jgi:hypothetical protein
MANKNLLSHQREEIRPQVQRLVSLAKDEAPKLSGEFSEGIKYRIFLTGGVLQFRVYSPSPLGDWISEGTEGHPIVAKKSSALAFIWENAPIPPNAPDGIHHIFNFVNHPGTKPNRFMGIAYRRWLPGARSALKKVALRWIGDLKR